MTLDELVRDLAKRGELTHLSLIPHGDGWSASYSAASPAGGFGSAEADDPVAALFGAVASVKPRRWRKKPGIEVSSAPMGSDVDIAAAVDIDITAAVNDVEAAEISSASKAKPKLETAADGLPVAGPR